MDDNDYYPRKIANEASVAALYASRSNWGEKTV